MISKWSYLGPLLLTFFTACANQTEDDTKEVSSTATPLSQRLSESGGFKQDAEGNWVPKSNKRSSFELQSKNPFFKGSIEKKEYKTGDYEKKSWWGKKEYKVEQYEGNTDGSRFKTEARQNGKLFADADKKAETGDPYETNTLEYRSARESDAATIDKPENDYTESRKRRYVQPSVMDWEERRKLSLEQSRGILGR
jgi:hypothetical protein